MAIVFDKMDVHPTPFPVIKAQSVKSKYKKITEAPKKTKEAPLQRQRRTFGTIRNPNLPTKTLPEKPKTKQSNPISVKQSKPTQTKTEPEPEPEPEITPLPIPDSAVKSSEKDNSNRAKPKKKKSVSFGESVTKISPARDVAGDRTPARPPFSAKAVRIPGTPYLSAEKCSSCRFDRLETSSYWLGQIKSAESVGKHFVSLAFFRLANDCRAEPSRNLRTELKRYLTRHEYLSNETGWKDVSHKYGILKEGIETESNKKEVNLIFDDMEARKDSKLGEIDNDQEQTSQHAENRVKEIVYEQQS